MNSQIFFIVTFLGNLLAFSLIAIWFVVPRLRRMSRASALLVLIFVNVFRTEGLTFLVPGVTGPHLPYSFAGPAAYGDLIAAILAFLALFALRAQSRIALPLVWVFNLEGTVDLCYALYQGSVIRFFSYQVGVTWFIPTLYVTLLLVTHSVIFWVLLRSPQPAKIQTA